MNGNIKNLNHNLTNVVLDSAPKVGGKVTKENSRKLSTITKDLKKKCSRMVITSIQNKIEAVELSKP